MRKIRIGITGQSGFIGSHLKSYLTTKQEKTELVPFSPFFLRANRIRIHSYPDVMLSFTLQQKTGNLTTYCILPIYPSWENSLMHLRRPAKNHM